MFYIPVILGSTRRDRQSPKAARFIIDRMVRSGEIEPELIDLAEYNFPIMEERLRFRDDPPPRLVEFSEKVIRADSLVIVTPEYNNGYPGVLKNALDYLLPEYHHKPVAIVTVSAGGFGGINCLAQLRLVLFGMGAMPLPVALPISRINDSIDEQGNPQDPSYEKRAQAFIDELLWFTSAIADKKSKDQTRSS